MLLPDPINQKVGCPDAYSVCASKLALWDSQDLKTGVPARGPWVRIPPSPPWIGVDYQSAITVSGCASRRVSARRVRGAIQAFAHGEVVMRFRPLGA